MESTDRTDRLLELATKINAEHEAGDAKRQGGLEHYRAAGLALIQAKRACGHGRWLPWLRTNVKFSERRARQYLAFAKSEVTADSPLEHQEREWRRVSGNKTQAAASACAVADPPASAAPRGRQDATRRLLRLISDADVGDRSAAQRLLADGELMALVAELAGERRDRDARLTHLEQARWHLQQALRHLRMIEDVGQEILVGLEQLGVEIEGRIVRCREGGAKLFA